MDNFEYYDLKTSYKKFFEGIRNKIENTINKTFTGWENILHRFRIYLIWIPWLKAIEPISYEVQLPDSPIQAVNFKYNNFNRTFTSWKNMLQRFKTYFEWNPYIEGHRTHRICSTADSVWITRQNWLHYQAGGLYGLQSGFHGYYILTLWNMLCNTKKILLKVFSNHLKFPKNSVKVSYSSKKYVHFLILMW